jgi:two-component system NtrC family sensor kinase
MNEYSVKSPIETVVNLTEEGLIRVLHVDDEVNLLKVAKEVLEKEGLFQVDTAPSVEEAMRRMKHETYDVVVSDYRMPGKDGLEFLKELRREGNTIPFIILTGRGMEEVAAQALNLGADHYVNKSVNPEMMFSELAHDICKAVEKKRADLAAWNRQERLRAVFNSSPNPIMVIDLQGSIAECNQETVQLLGSPSKQELIGRNILEFVENSARDRRRLSECLKKTLEQGTVKHVEFALLTKWGRASIGEISASIVRDLYGKATSFVVIISDITERKRAESKLRRYSKRLEENQRFLENVFAAFPDAVIVCDRVGNIIKCNSATLGLHDYSSENELVGVNLYALFSQKDRERALEELKKVTELGSIRNVEYTVLKRDGNEFPAELAVGAIVDSFGNSLGLVAITKDITDRKRLQEQLIVSEKLAAVGQLAASFSHDIRNPLAVIKNSISFLEMRLNETTDDKVRKHLRIMGEEIDHAGVMVNDLLDFARKNPPRLQEANLNGVVTNALSSLSIPEKVKLAFKPGQMPPILIDEAQLQRVFTNIIMNAVQAMPNGGKLIVQTSKDHNSAEITFSDTGIGISEENLRKISTPFFSTKTTGVGLGLCICKQIVEGHGGRITVRSKEGNGSTFTIKLPIHTKRRAARVTPTRSVIQCREVNQT